MTKEKRLAKRSPNTAYTLRTYALAFGTFCRRQNVLIPDRLGRGIIQTSLN